MDDGRHDTDPGSAGAGDLGARLLGAHTEHVLAQLDGDEFAALVEREIDRALALASMLTLDDVVTRQSVKAVAVKYVAAFDLPGAIPETAGEIALRVRAHAASHDLPIGDLLGHQQIADVLDKIAELRVVREQLIAAFAASPTVQQGLADFLHSLATGTVASNRRLVERLPGMSTTLSLGQRLAGAPLRQAEQLSREVAERTAGVLLGRLRSALGESVSDADVSEALREVWAAAAQRPVSEIVGALDPDDLIDAIVLGYDLWLNLRTSPYLLSLIESGVDYVFDTYGGFSLTELLAEFGLNRDDLVAEALRFAPRALNTMRVTGILRDLVHRQLADFYDSPAARAIIDAE